MTLTWFTGWTPAPPCVVEVTTFAWFNGKTPAPPGVVEPLLTD